MSMGSDFAGGYKIGLDTRQASSGWNHPNPWPYLVGNAQNISNEKIALMRSGGGGGSRAGKSAKQILEESRIAALKEKEMELANKEQQIANERAEQDMRAARMQEVDRRAKEAEGRAQGLRTQNEATAKTREADMGKRAIEGAYTRQSRPIMDYINRNGNKDANVEAVDFTDPDGKDTGKIYVKFSDGQTVAYDNAAEFGKQVVLPMEAIQKGIAGQMTEKQAADIGLDEREVAVKEKGLDTKIKPNIVPESDRAKLKADFINKRYTETGKMPTPEEIRQFETMTFGDGANSIVRGKIDKSGLATGGSDLRSQAEAAIRAGKNPEAVKKRYKELTGKDYDSGE